MPYLEPSTARLPFQSESPTSYDAAVRQQAVVQTQRAVYFDWLKARGDHGGTDAEAEAIPMKRQSICARRNELEKQGLVVKTDQRRGGCAVYRTQE